MVLGRCCKGTIRVLLLGFYEDYCQGTIRVLGLYCKGTILRVLLFLVVLGKNLKGDPSQPYFWLSDKGPLFRGSSPRAPPKPNSQVKGSLNPKP